MSPVNKLSVVAFAAGAFAIPQAGYRHGHHHNHPGGYNSASGSASAWGSASGLPYPYPVANATGLWGTTGTGSAPTAYSSAPVAPVESASYSGPIVYVSPVPASPSAATSSVDTYVNAASTTECTTDVTVTTTEKTYVTVTATYGDESSSSAKPTSTITEHSTVYYTPSSSASGAISASANSSYVASASGYPSPSVNATSVAPVSLHSTTTLTVQSTVYPSMSGPAAYTPQTSSEASSTSSSSSAEVSPVTESSSSSAAPAPSSYSAPEKAPAYSAPPAYSSAPAPSSYVAPTTSSSAVVSSAWSTSSTTSSAPAYSSSASASSGGAKRGLGYNDAALTSCFMDSPNVGWAYNWGSENGGFTPTSSVNYVPTLWGTRSDFTSVWEDNANAAISAGSKYLFSFNEPDMSTQANMSPEDAASAWKQYMEPFAGKAQLCAPSVTNGGGEMGLTWLSNFLAACSDCTIDCVNIHWYSQLQYADTFKDQVTNATTVSGKPVFVSEFAPTDGSDSDKSDFLQDVMPWMGKSRSRR